MDDRCQNIINGLDSLMLPANEEYSDISLFFKDDDFYLESYHKNNPEEIYTEPLGIEGVVANSVIKAGRELTKVNAYTEALLIYQSFIDKLEMVSEGLDRFDRGNIQNTIDTIQGFVLDTMKERDEYHSKRKSIIARYSGLTKNL